MRSTALSEYGSISESRAIVAAPGIAQRSSDMRSESSATSIRRAVVMGWIFVERTDKGFYLFDGPLISGEKYFFGYGSACVNVRVYYSP